MSNQAVVTTAMVKVQESKQAIKENLYYRKEVSILPKTSDHIQKMAPLVRYHDISHFLNYCISEPSPSRGQKIQQFLGK